MSVGKKRLKSIAFRLLEACYLFLAVMWKHPCFNSYLI